MARPKKIEIPGSLETNKKSIAVEKYVQNISNIADEINSMKNEDAKKTISKILDESLLYLEKIKRFEQNLAANSVQKSNLENVNLKKPKINIIEGNGITLTEGGYIVKNRGKYYE